MELTLAKQVQSKLIQSLADISSLISFMETNGVSPISVGMKPEAPTGLEAFYGNSTYAVSNDQRDELYTMFHDDKTQEEARLETGLTGGQVWFNHGLYKLESRHDQKVIIAEIAAAKRRGEHVYQFARELHKKFGLSNKGWTDKYVEGVWKLV